MKAENIKKLLQGIDLIREVLVAELEGNDVIVEEIIETGINDNYVPTPPYETMTVKQLRELVDERGIFVPVKANKSVYIERLQENENLETLIIENQEIVEEIKELQEFGVIEEELTIEDNEMLKETEKDIEDLKELQQDIKKEYIEELGLPYPKFESKPIEELADICNIYGLSTKGKKEALLSRIIEAFENGVITLESIQANLDSTTDETQKEEFIPKFEGSNERQNRCLQEYNDMKDSYYRTKELTFDDVEEFVYNYYEGNEEISSKIESEWLEDDFFRECALIQSNLIDDELNSVDFEEPYLVGETPYCCGKPMIALGKGVYECSHDKGQVELED